MYLNLTETKPQCTPITGRRTTQTNSASDTTVQSATRKTIPDPQIEAWARHAESANGFGECY